MIDIRPATIEINGETYELHPAKIEATTLGFEHGMLTALLHLNYGGSGQSAGQYILSRKEGEEQLGTAYGCDWLIRTLRTVGVEDWEKLPGKRVYAVRSLRTYPFVQGLLNIDGKGEPFMFKAHADRWKERER